MTGAKTERHNIRKKAFDNKNFGFRSSTAKRAKAMITTNIPSPRMNTGKNNISYVLSGDMVKYKMPKNTAKQAIPPAIRKRKRQRCHRNHQKQIKAPKA